MGHAATLVAEYEALAWRTETLVREFQPALSAGTVIRTVTRCRAELRRSGVRSGLARATEEMARARLQQRASALTWPRAEARARTAGSPRNSDEATTAAAGAHGSAGSDRAGHSSSRAPSTAACSENR